MGMIFWVFIAGPIALALALCLVPKKYAALLAPVTVVWAAVDFVAALLFWGKVVTVSLPMAGLGMDFSLRLYHFSGFILLAVAFFSVMVSLYSSASMKDKPHARYFYSFILLTLGLVNGAVLSDNLIVLLFFGEALLIPLFGMIAIGKPGAFRTALKAFVIMGIADLCLAAGIALTAMQAGTFEMSKIHLAIDSPLSFAAFILLMIGAVSKAGSIPFHTWIPDAAEDAPLPFMAFMPASLDKLLGIYLLARVSMDLFVMVPESMASFILMTLGAVMILVAVMMALVQKHYLRLLAYHAISQVGYMVLGIGTGLPVGIVGGLFHMLNHSLYKSCLFFTGGAVEHAAGSAKLEELGALRLKMPITFTCFIIAAASISGAPPFNGFFSKELVYDAALERHWIFYAAAALGSFLTAISFLKLGHAAFCGKGAARSETAKEVPWPMLVPMITIASLCVLFGVWNYLPLSQFIVPVLGAAKAGHHVFWGIPTNLMIVGITVAVLLAAFFEHFWAVDRTGSALHAADPICKAPVLSGIYDWAARKYFDPYEMGMKLVGMLTWILAAIDHAIDTVYNRWIPDATMALANAVRYAHGGSHALYILWSLAGAAGILWVVLK